MLDEKNLKNSNDIIMTQVVFTVFFFIFGIKYLKAVLKDVVRTGILRRVMLCLCNDRLRTAAAGGRVQYLHNM